ncbi:hypothetical protein L218DRAFT_39974 [Marasmius fiardii PR-910]|nr:hypothetical protein L218DRAFT_39974 [Marasmius fiardii PR-910]
MNSNRHLAVHLFSKIIAIKSSVVLCIVGFPCLGYENIVGCGMSSGRQQIRFQSLRCCRTLFLLDSVHSESAFKDPEPSPPRSPKSQHHCCNFY